MKIVLVGGGKVGAALARQLSEEGHNVTVVDTNKVRVEHIGESYDVMSILGNGSSITTLSEAGVEDADVFIAVTGSDELNLLCCMFAKKAGHCHAIARVRNPMYVEELNLIKDDLGLSLSVNPELLCATEIARTLRIPSAIKTDTFANGHVELLKVQIPQDSLIAGKTLMELPSLVKAKILICAVERGEQEVYIPSGSFRLEAGDRISFVASIRDAQAFFHQIKLASSRVRTVLIVGGGHIAYYLAKQLTDLGVGVKITEVNYERCLQLSSLLPKAEILHGDGTNEGFLRECGVAQTDAFAALTGIDEENVLMGLYVRKTFPKVKVITKINRYSFQSIIETMDLGSVFNPRFSTSNVICRYARSMQNSLGSNVETLYKLVGGKAEALEFRVAEGSAVCGIPLQTLRLRQNLLIGCINRAGKILIPSGQDTIEPGDTVVVVTSVTGLNELDDILEKRRG